MNMFNLCGSVINHEYLLVARFKKGHQGILLVCCIDRMNIFRQSRDCVEYFIITPQYFLVQQTSCCLNEVSDRLSMKILTKHEPADFKKIAKNCVMLNKSGGINVFSDFVHNSDSEIGMAVNQEELSARLPVILSMLGTKDYANKKIQAEIRQMIKQ
jgi:hypothetical protein